MCAIKPAPETSVISFGNKGQGYLYSITNADMNTTIYLLENGTKSREQSLFPDNRHAMGTYFITIACQWTIDIPQFGKITPDLPCRTDARNGPPIIRIVIPSRWSTLDPSLLSRAADIHDEITSSEGYKDVKSIFNVSWREQEAVMDYHVYHFKKYADLVEHWDMLHYVYEHGLRTCWDLCMTAAIAYLWLQSRHTRLPARVLTSSLYSAVPIAHATMNSNKTVCDVDLENKLMVLFVSIGITALTGVAIFICVLHLYFRRKWSGRGTRVTCIRDEKDTYPYTPGPPRSYTPPRPYRETALSHITYSPTPQNHNPRKSNLQGGTK